MNQNPTIAELEGGHLLTKGVLFLLAISAGLSVANSYYNQPMLAHFRQEFGIDAATVALVPFITQFGNAAGVLFIAPLGDRIERKKLILITTVALVVSLVAAAQSSSFTMVIVASIFVGLFATVAQQIVPMAVHIAPANKRGQILGTVTSGILIGIILSRTISGVVTEFWDWHAMFYLAAAFMGMTGLLLARKLPRVEPQTVLTYPALLESLLRLLKEHPVLRKAVVIQALIFASFLAFWANLVLLLADEPYQLGSSTVGLIALIGAGGAFVAPLAGRFADQKGSKAVMTVGAGMVMASFMALGLFQNSLVILIIGAVILDLGVQSSQIANQAQVYALDPNARSRLNTIFMSTMLVGGAIGAWAGGAAYEVLGWTGCCLFGFVSSLIAMVVTRTQR